MTPDTALEPTASIECEQTRRLVTENDGHSDCPSGEGASTVFFVQTQFTYEKYLQRVRESNPCTSLERAVS